MNEFISVTITKEASVYFDGKVTSRKVTFADGSVKILGIMIPGDYCFGTNEKEIMEIIAGDCEILLPNNSKWQKLSAGQFFEVPANAEFQIKAKTLIDYCCSYIA